MTFKEVLGQVVDWLQQDSHVSYLALKRPFDLDDNDLAELKEALAFSHPRLEMKKDEGWSGPESDQQFPQSHDLRRIERYTLGVSSDCLHGGVDAWGRVRKKVLAGHIEVELERYCEFLPAVGESTNPIIRGAPWIPISI